jgi:hypothetical protein
LSHSHRISLPIESILRGERERQHEEEAPEGTGRVGLPTPTSLSRRRQTPPPSMKRVATVRQIHSSGARGWSVKRELVKWRLTTVMGRSTWTQYHRRHTPYRSMTANLNARRGERGRSGALTMKRKQVEKKEKSRPRFGYRRLHKHNDKRASATVSRCYFFNTLLLVSHYRSLECYNNKKNLPTQLLEP